MGGRPRTKKPIFFNELLAGAIKSTPRFDRANKISAESTIQFDLIALICLAFRLRSVLIGSSFVATIAIAQGDPDDGDKNNQDGVRRAA